MPSTGSSEFHLDPQEISPGKQRMGPKTTLSSLRSEVIRAGIRVKHPIHSLPENAGMEGVQRIVLAAPRPESVGEPEEVFLVDCFENRRDRLLDDFVLQAQNAQRTLRATAFGMWVRLAGRAR